MKRLLKNKAGVTILEGLIALLLLAMISVGTFGVLLATSRQSSKPDIREEMGMAVEKANNFLQAYMYLDIGDEWQPFGTDAFGSDPTISEHMGDTNLIQELNSYFGADPLSEGTHNIPKLLPSVCDPNISEFTYTVSKGLNDNNPDVTKDFRESYGALGMDERNRVGMYEINYYIKCNGYTYGE